MLINFFGKRGAGKTTAIKGQLPDCHGSVVILDILGNFQDINGKHTNSDAEAISAIAEYLKNPIPENKFIVLQTRDPDLSADYISAALWESRQGTLILDEVDGFSIANAPCFDELIRYGRNRNVHLITGCRRPAELSRNITAGANKLYAFQTQEPRDIDYFRSTVFGDKAEQLMSIEKFSGLYIDYDSGQIGKFRIDTEGRIYHAEAVDTKTEKDFEELEEQNSNERV